MTSQQRLSQCPPAPAPLSLVNFPLAAVDSKIPPLEIFSR